MQVIEPNNDVALEHFYMQLGPTLTKIIASHQANEIMLNDDGRVLVEYLDGITQEVTFIDSLRASTIIRTLATLTSHQLDLSMPILTCSIPLINARFEGLLPPIVRQPSFCIRLHHGISSSLESLYNSGFIDEFCFNFLLQALFSKRSILIAGPTSSGKTTLLNALLNDLLQQDPMQRLICIEDSAELNVNGTNVLSLFANNYNELSTLIKSALRMRPDRIILGEIRGAEALDLLDAFTTGHDGSMSTMHASSIDNALFRLSLLVSRHPNAPKFIEQTIASALDLLLIVNNQPQRKLVQIAKIEDFSNQRFNYSIIY